MLKLYEIPSEIRRIMETGSDPETGELTDAAIMELDAIQMNLETKADGVCAIVREELSLESAVTAEIDRLRKMQVAHASRAARLKEYLKLTLEATGQKKLEMARFKVRIQANPPAASCVIDPKDLPDEFKWVRVEPDNRAAIDAWKKTGQAPEGFEIRQGTHLRIV